MSSVTIDTSQFDKFKVVIDKYPSKVNKGVTETVKTSTFNVEKYAKENLTKNGNVDTGHLRNSTNSKVMGMEGTVSNNVKYARVIEEGSKPHKIRAKGNKYLYWNGASHPVKEVNHPGTKPYPYMRPALEKEIPNFIKELHKTLDLD